MPMIRVTCAVVVSWLVFAATACGNGSPSAGKERGVCYGNGTCDQGLLCLSDRCVRPPPADCDKVGAKLATYRLGNYAPREERDKVVAELAAKCQGARLSIDEGKCILDAPSRVEVSKCPRPLLDELKADKTGCRAAAEALAAAFITEMVTDAGKRERAQPAIDDLTDGVQQVCMDDLWSDQAKRCIGRAKRMDDLKPCEDTLSKAQQQSAEDKLEAMMERLEDVLKSN